MTTRLTPITLPKANGSATSASRSSEAPSSDQSSLGNTRSKTYYSVSEECAAISAAFFAKFPHLHPTANGRTTPATEIEVGED